MQSVLNVEVSIFPNYVTPDNPARVNMLTWLTSSKYADRVAAIRATSDKSERDKLKATLPAITPSGLFTRRAESCLIDHSGLLQFDIDFKENKHIENFGDLKAELCKVKNIAYCGLSVSGNGFWGLVPITDPTRHKAHFEALRTWFATWGIIIDDKPKNVASLRGYSYDPDGYFNHYATPYSQQITPEPERYAPRSQPPRFQTSETAKTEAIISQIEAGRVDLTADYGDWFAIGCALANEFGESGRDYFHRVSQYYSGYDVAKTDKQYDHCKRGKGGHSIAMFYKIAAMRGIYYKNALGATQRPTAPRTQPQAKANTVERFVNVYGDLVEVEITPDGIPASWTL